MKEVSPQKNRRIYFLDPPGVWALQSKLNQVSCLQPSLSDVISQTPERIQKVEPPPILCRFRNPKVDPLLLGHLYVSLSLYGSFRYIQLSYKSLKVDLRFRSVQGRGLLSSFDWDRAISFVLSSSPQTPGRIQDVDQAS